MSSSARPRSPRPLRDLFASQYGLITPAQLRAAGVGPALQRVRVERGELEEYAPGVLRLCGVPDDWRQPLQAATLASSRVSITAGTTLRLHGIDGFRDFDDVWAIARLGDKPRLADGVQLWRSRRLTDDDVMVLDGIRTTTLATALVHAAALHDDARFERALDDTLRRAVSPGWLQATAERWSGPGSPGSGRLAAALAARCDQRLPRSWFERLARTMLAAHGIELEHEVAVRDGGRLVAVLDLALVPLKVGVECQSWEWHSTPAAQRADARRKRRLVRMGWAIVELWWSDLHHPRTVVEDILAATERQRRLLGGVQV